MPRLYKVFNFGHCILGQGF